MAQTYTPQGPNVSTGNIFTVQSGDAPPNGSVAGALGAVVPSPTDANTLYVSSPNGGIWKTVNGGATWTALTSTQADLSVASLALDPTDPTSRTLIAGTGLSSNGTVCQNGNCFFAGSGNAPAGLLMTRDGGATWTTLGAATLAGQTVDAVAERGQVILAGTFEMSYLAPAAQRMVGGLYRSTDGGATFNLVSGGAGLPAGPVSSIVGDPANTNRLYAAVTAPNATAGGLASTAVYVSNDAGANWAPVFTSANSAGTITGAAQTAIRVAAGPNGTLAVGVFTMPNTGAGSGTLTGLFYSGNSGTTWTQLTVPTINNGGQATPNFAIAIDPNNPRFVYISGDRIAANPFTVSAFRIDAIANTATSLTDATFTANGSTVHADSRALAFDANGRLLLVGDGGIYARSQPQTTAGTWVSLNNLSVREIGSIGYDAVSKRLAVAAQDTGAAIQNAPNATQYTAVNAGDGSMVAINDRTIAGNGVFYTASQNLAGLNRFVFDAQGNVIGPAGGAQVLCNGAACSSLPGLVFSAPFVLNKIDPSRIAIGGDQVYITQDLTGANGPAAATVNLAVTGLTAFGGSVVKIAYGTNDNANAILAGDAGGTLALSTTATAGSFNVLGAYTGGVPTALVFDNRTQNRFFAADYTNIFGTRDRGNTFQNLTANLPANFVNPAALEFISNNGVNALLVGGVNTAANAPSTVVAADSDANGNLSGWRFFGQGLPNVQVSQLVYNPQVDVLAVGTFGRGAFAMYDVTSNFAQATVLQFGLANNDSNPSAAILTNGTSANRPLIKYGTGTLTIAGAASYTGGTTINNGTLQIGNGGNAGSIIGNVAFCANAGDPLCNATTNKALAFNRTDSFTFGGSISGPGQVFQNGTGTTVLTASSTYSGATTVNAGTLQVDGTLASRVTVNPGARLTGIGTTGGIVVGTGAVVTPGDPRPNGTQIGNLRANGALIMQPGSAAVFEIGTTADELLVSETSSLAGTAVLSFNSGPIARRSVLVSSQGGDLGTFDAVQTNLPSFFSSQLLYAPTEVDLLVTSNFMGIPGLNQNQKAVANLLDTSFNNGGGTLFGLLGLNSTAQISPALTALTGESATGAQQTTFQAMTQFLGTLLDPFIDGRGNAAPPASASPAFATDDSAANAYASSSRKRTDAERDAYVLFTKTPLRAAYDPHWSVWASGFGGSQTTAGNAAVGSNTATSNIAATAVGADYLMSPRTIAGFAMAGGGTGFSVNNLGTGRSDLFMAGAFVRHTAGAAYVAAALAYGWQDVTTDRTVTITGIDHLRAQFNANAWSGRLEGGYRFVAPWIGGVGITPYAAGAFTTFDLPAYNEGVVFGANTYALGYNAKSVTDTRSELGVRSDKSFALENGIVTLRGRVAWAHDFNPDRNISATFQTLPGASFVVNGAAQASDSALTTASAELKWTNNWSIAATFEGEFSNVTSSYAGKGVVRYAW